MQTSLRFKLACFSGLLLHACLPVGQLYSQQEKRDQPIAAKSEEQPKLIKTQGSTEHDNIHAMLQDKNGDMWFATTGEGVYRYNGSGFVQYTQKDGLSSNTVYSMIEDSSGTIWFGTSKGVSRYDGKTISPVPFKFDSRGRFSTELTLGGTREDTNEVWSILQLKSGSLWFGTTNGLYCFDGSKFTRLLDDVRIVNLGKLKLKNIQCMLQDRSGIIWLGSGLGETEGLCRYDGKSITSVKPKMDGWIRQIFQDKSGAIWLTTRSQGIWRNTGDGFVKLPIQDDGIGKLLQVNQAMMQDRLGNIWFGGSESVGTVQSNGGVWRYDGVKFENFTIEDGLSTYGVWSMLEDTAGNIWMGTRNTGLTRFDGSHFANLSE